MRICVDATSLLLRSAGVKSYTYHWVKALRAQAGEDAVRAFPAIGPLGELHHDRSMLSALQTYPRIALLHGANYVSGVLDAALHGIDLFHASNQVRRAPQRTKLTATIHDLTCWLMPELHTAANVRADQEFADRVLKKADALIAVSENTRQDAIRLLGLPPEKIRTIYSGVDERFFAVSDAEAMRVRQAHGLAKPYVLFVGTVEPRKNLDLLLNAWTGISPDLREAYELVIAGPIGWAAAETGARLRSGLPGVRYLGYFPEADLPGLTKGATMFAYPSLYEGFGFPVAQAMACGVPVLTSDASCLPEVTERWAVLVDPRSEAELCDGLGRLLTSATTRETLARQGRRTAERYRWQQCAQESWELFASV